jgi:hypothetical protein
MSNASLERVLEEVKTLSPDEQRQVRDLIDSLLENRAEDTASLSPEDLLEQRLLEAGVISRIPPSISDLTPYKNRKPVEVKGKPVSETIIEERR